MTTDYNDVRNGDYLKAEHASSSRVAKDKAYFVEGECITDDLGDRHFVKNLDLHGFSHWRPEHDRSRIAPGYGLLRIVDRGEPWFTKGKVYLLDASLCMVINDGSRYSATNFAKPNFVLLKSIKAEEKEVSEQSALAIKVESYLKENGYTSGNIPLVLATFLKDCLNLCIECSYSVVEEK